MQEIKTILVTTDFSKTSAKAFSLARGFAERFDAKLILAHVEEYRLPPLGMEYSATTMEDLLRNQRDRTLGELRQLAKEQFGNGPGVEIEMVAGVPHAEIVSLATERGVDMIIMATHGRGFISHALIGSTTERVLRRAPCPVLVVRDAD